MTVTEMGTGRLIFLDRQAADDPTLNVFEQMNAVLGIVEQGLTSAGARPLHILSVRIDLADAIDYEVAMRVWATWARAGRVAARPTLGFLEESRGPLVMVTIVAAFRPDPSQER